MPYPGARLIKDEDVKPGEPHHAYTDQCDHVFTYSLYPHLGDHIEGNVIHAGYELNAPLCAFPIIYPSLKASKGTLPKEASFFKVDRPNIIIESVKKAEDSDDIIIRLYESEHRRCRAKVQFGFSVVKIEEVDLMENTINSINLNSSNTVKLNFHPFEIKTLKLVTK